MVLIPVLCPYCQSDQIIKRGKTDSGKQRYRCQNRDCSHQSFVLNPTYKGRLPDIKQQVVDMSLNGSGIRDIARVLKISTDTVINEFKNGFVGRETPFVMEGTPVSRLSSPFGRSDRRPCWRFHPRLKTWSRE